MSNNKFKILIVEDEPTICSFIYTLLDTNGYKTYVAPTCELGKSIFTSYLPDSFVVIPMDSMLISQVLMNLLENAVLHAEGMTKLTLRVFTLGDHAIFEVSDDGCGIPKERLKGLFTRLLPASPCRSTCSPRW